MDTPSETSIELFIKIDYSPETIRCNILKAIVKSNILFYPLEADSFKGMAGLLGVSIEDAKDYFFELCSIVYSAVGVILTGYKQHTQVNYDICIKACTYLFTNYELKIEPAMVKDLNQIYRNKEMGDKTFKEI